MQVRPVGVGGGRAQRRGRVALRGQQGSARATGARTDRGALIRAGREIVSAHRKHGETEARVGQREAARGCCAHRRPTLPSLGGGGMTSVRPGGMATRTLSPGLQVSVSPHPALTLGPVVWSQFGSMASKCLSSRILKNSLLQLSPPPTYRRHAHAGVLARGPVPPSRSHHCQISFSTPRSAPRRLPGAFLSLRLSLPLARRRNGELWT